MKNINSARSLALSLLMAIPLVSPASDWREQLLQQDRCLKLYRPETKEHSSFCYWRLDSGYDINEYKKANWALRDWKYKKQTVMDPKLLDTLFIIQQWLILEGRKGSIHLLSGYRTPEHNFRLEGAAKQSLHMKGKAADIHVPGVSTKLLAAMSRLISAGGVGIYLDRNFIHVDTGNVRTWKGK